MRIPKFEYLAPKKLEDAVSFLKKYKGDIKVVAGGTDLIVNMKQRTITPKYLINLKEIADLDFINYKKNDGLKIGALTALRTIEKSGVIREKFPVIAKAAHEVASVQIRNVGTLGGNICLNTRCWYYNQPLYWRKSFPFCFKVGGDCCNVVKKGKQCYALFSADTVPALIGLDAKIKVV
ncbi:MAG: FAD binding domain-containing protein, partial [Thermodesulfobacteriota bacterium]|nr:FAD binding domain-containing protein [Thermodesulfobacteriota bacterium]